MTYMWLTLRSYLLMTVMYAVSKLSYTASRQKRKWRTTFGLRMSDVDLLYFKEKQLIIIMDKLNISTLNCEGPPKSKDYIKTYLDNNSCDILALQETWHLDNTFRGRCE